MKKYLHILPACFLFYAAAHAQQKDTVYVTDFEQSSLRTRTVLHKYRLPSTNVNAREPKCYHCPKAAMTSGPKEPPAKEYFTYIEYIHRTGTSPKSKDRGTDVP